MGRSLAMLLLCLAFAGLTMFSAGALVWGVLESPRHLAGAAAAALAACGCAWAIGRLRRLTLVSSGESAQQPRN